VSSKAECPACKAYLSGVYDAAEGIRAACPSCNLPGSVIREVFAARQARADAELTGKLEAALVRAGKAEAEAALLRKHITSIKKVVEDVPSPPDDEYGW
jgi:nitrate/TMAO reductase-like tetraheme cytochrome c subunit